MPNPAQSKRKNISLSVKREVIRKKDGGMGNSAIGRAMGLHESTVRCILRKREEILKCINAYGTGALDNRVRSYDCSELVKTERFLALWISRKESEGVPLDKRVIIDQAKKFFECICRKEGKIPSGFKASSGWLYNFLKRKGIRNVKLTGESHSADELAALAFPEILEGIMEDGGYHADDVYNMDEAGLIYKKMPGSTFLAKNAQQARGRKMDKSRLTLALCVNMSGTHKVKPCVVHTAKRPHCFHNVRNMDDLPVFWRKAPKGWMRSDVMKDWLLNCFVPEVKKKCQEDGRSFNVLLLLDNCSSHPSWLQDIHPNVRIEFLPPNTTSLIQPLDQEIIACVKAKYHQSVFERMRKATASDVELQQILEEENGEDDDEDDVTENPPEKPEFVRVTRFWKQFTVKDAVDSLVPAWDAISVATIRRAWRKIAPNHIPQDPEEGMGIIQRSDEEVAAAVLAAREVPGCSDVTEEELVAVYAAGEETTTEDIMNSAAVEDALQQQRQEEGRVEGVVEGNDSEKPLSMNAISNILSMADGFLDNFSELETSSVRFSEFKNNFTACFRYYKEVHMKKMNERKQALITKYVRSAPSASPTREEPEPGPSNSAEEGVDVEDLFTEDDLETFEGFLM